MSFTCSLFIYLCVHMLSFTLSRSVTPLPYLSLSHTHTHTHTHTHNLFLSPTPSLDISAADTIYIWCIFTLLLLNSLFHNTFLFFSFCYSSYLISADSSPTACDTHLLSLLSHLHLKPPNLLYRKLPLQDRDHKNILNHRTLHCPLRQQLLPNKINIKIEIKNTLIKF